MQFNKVEVFILKYVAVPFAVADLMLSSYHIIKWVLK